MSGVAAAAAVATSVSAYMAYEQNRMARSTQREQNTRIKQEQAKIDQEIAFEKKKKQEQDILNSRLALKLRNSGLTPPSGIGMSQTGLNQPLSVGLDKLGL
jgi:ADP-ribosylglycohydrolase